MALATLKKRGEYLRVRGGRRWSTPAFLLEGKPRLNSNQHASSQTAKPTTGPSAASPRATTAEESTRPAPPNAEPYQFEQRSNPPVANPDVAPAEGARDAKSADRGKIQPRFGFTVTKKMGNAIARNRIRRRLKAAIAELAPTHADPTFDYVVLARKPALDRAFADVLADLRTAFQRLHTVRSSHAGSSAKRNRATRRPVEPPK